MHDMIYKLIQSEDLLEVKRHLITIDDVLEQNAVNRPQFCKFLSQALMEWTLMPRVDIFDKERDPRYHIYSEHSSIPPYLASFGLSLGRVREVRQCVKALVSTIDETIIAPSGICLTVEDEKKVLAVLIAKFPYLEIVSAESPLTILNLGNTHRLYNSMCGSDENASAFVVYMFNMKDGSFIPEYVFLHELGHALQAAITGSVLTVPDEFITFHNLMPDTPRIEQGNADATELFADAFAISVMRGTELSCFDPFHFSDAFNGLFELFFKKLF